MCNPRSALPSWKAGSRSHLDNEDGLLIQQVEANAVLLNTALRWFKKRRQDAAVATNVVAFPVPALPEARAA